MDTTEFIVLAGAVIVLAIALYFIGKAIRWTPENIRRIMIAEEKQEKIDELRAPEAKYIHELAHRWYRGRQFFAFGTFKDLEEATKLSARYDNLVLTGHRQEANELLYKVLESSEGDIARREFSTLPPQDHLSMFLQDHPELKDDADYRLWALHEFIGQRHVWDESSNYDVQQAWRDYVEERQRFLSERQEELDKLLALETSRKRVDELKRHT